MNYTQSGRYKLESWKPSRETFERKDFELPSAEVGMPVAAEMIGEIKAIVRNPILLARLFSPRSPSAPGDAAEAAAAVVVFKGETHMAVGESTRRGQQPSSACEEDGIGVAETEGRQLLEGAEEIRGDLGEAELEVKAQLFSGGRKTELAGSDAGEGVAKLRHVSGGQSETDGVSVTAEAREELVGRLLVCRGERVEQMEPGNGAAGAVRYAIFMCEH